MTTTKQRAANRQNAQKSTGTKTPEGKVAVSRNAVKHGLLSRYVLLGDEDETALVELGKRLRAQLHPIGALEGFLVERIITAVWRLRRVLASETGLFETYCPEGFSLSQPASLGGVILRDHGDRLTRVLRYETTIERGLYKALHALQRVQAARAGVPVPPPAADVDVPVTVQGSGEDQPSWLCLAKMPCKTGKKSTSCVRSLFAALLLEMHAFRGTMRSAIFLMILTKNRQECCRWVVLALAGSTDGRGHVPRWTR
jgi:hypothetical protein